jgi:hypothetical protein
MCGKQTGSSGRCRRLGLAPRLWVRRSGHRPWRAKPGVSNATLARRKSVRRMEQAYVYVHTVGGGAKIGYSVPACYGSDQRAVAPFRIQRVLAWRWAGQSIADDLYCMMWYVCIVCMLPWNTTPVSCPAGVQHQQVPMCVAASRAAGHRSQQRPRPITLPTTK